MIRGGDRVALDPTIKEEKQPDEPQANPEHTKRHAQELLARLCVRSDDLVAVQTRLDKVNSALKYTNILQSISLDQVDSGKNAAAPSPFEFDCKLTTDSEARVGITNKSVTLEDPFCRFYRLTACLRLEKVSAPDDCTYKILNKQQCFMSLRPGDNTHTVVFDLKSSIGEGYFPASLTLFLSFNTQSFLRAEQTKRSETTACYADDEELEDLFDELDEEGVSDVTVCLHRYDFQLGDFLIDKTEELCREDPASVLAFTNDCSDFFRDFLLYYEMIRKERRSRPGGEVRSELELVWNSISIGGISNSSMLKSVCEKLKGTSGARFLYSNLTLSLSRADEDEDDSSCLSKLTIAMDKFGIDRSNQVLLLQNLPFMNFLRYKFLNKVVFDFFLEIQAFFFFF
jgi:hypothetical protein